MWWFIFGLVLGAGILALSGQSRVTNRRIPSSSEELSFGIANVAAVIA